MSPDLKGLPPIAARRLREYYRRKRFYGLLRVILSAGSAYLVLALVVMHLDRFLFLETSTRVLMTTIVHAVGILYALLLAGLFAVRRVSTRRLAYELESRLPREVSERFVTLASLDAGATDGARGEVSQSLIDQLVRETIAYSESFFGGRLVLDRRFRLLGVVAATLLGLYVLLQAVPGYQFDLMMRRFAMPRANLPKPSFVTLEVSPEAAVLGRGGEIVIQARTEGAIPDALAWLYRLAGIMPGDCRLTIVPENPSLPSRTVDMSRIQRTLFLHSSTHLQESFAFRVRAADAETSLHPVEIVVQPTITEARLTLTPPAYTRLPVVTLTHVQDAVSIYAGTQVEVEFHVDQDVDELEVSLPRDRTARPDWDSDTRTGSYQFNFAEPFDMEITAVNDRGFANTIPVRIPFRLRDDQRPTISLRYPTNDLASVPGELIPIQFRVEDDLGIDQVFIQYFLNPDDEMGRPPQELAIPFDDSGEALSLDLTYMFDLDTTGAVPGDQLLFLVRARDSGGNDGESRSITVTLTAFARGENERRRLAVLAFIQDALQRLVHAEEDIETVGAGIREQAEERGIPLEPGPIPAALLLLMEQEHHFTDHPLHKADMQKLAGLVRAATSGGGDSPESTVLQLASSPIADLIAARRLQNTIWGYFGLAYELASIRERMAETEAHRQSRGQTVESLMSTHARALAQAVREDAAMREEVAKLAERLAMLEAARAAVQQTRDALAAELPPGMSMAFQPDSPELRRLVTEVSDQREAVAAIQQTIRQRARELGDNLLTTEEHQFLDQYVEPSVVQAIQSTIASQAATDHDLPLDPLVPETIRSQLPVLPAPASDMQSINRRTSLFLRSAENTGAALAGLPWGADFDLDRLRMLQSDLNAAIHRMTRTSESLTRRATSGDEIHDRIMATVALLSGQMPALRIRETLARQDLASAVQAARSRLQGRDLADWLLADMSLMSYNPFADLAPSLYGIARMDGRDATPSRLHEILVEPGAESPPVISGQGYLLALDHEVQSLLDHPRVQVAERDLAFRFLALDAALFFGAVSPTQTASDWHAAIATFDPAAPGVGPNTLDALLKGIDTSGAEGPSPRLLELLANHVLPDARGALQAILRRWRTSETMFETTQGAIRAGNESLSQPFARLLEVIQTDVDALESFLVRLHMRLAWLPNGPPASTDHALMLRLREMLGRFQVRSAPAVATVDGFTRRPMGAADTTEALTALQGLALNLKVLRDAAEGLLNDSEPIDTSRYALLATFEETARLRELATAALAGENPAALAPRYLDAFPHAAGYFIADRRERLVAASRHIRHAIERLEADTIASAEVDAAIEAAAEQTGAFVTALDAVDTEEAGRLRAEARELRNRIAAQRFGDIAPEPGAARQRLFNLTESASQLARLIGRIADGPDEATAAATVFSGGPENIWTRENRMHAEYARSRLHAQSAHADRRIAAGLLAVYLPEALAPTARRAAADWSGFLYRLVRSPLTGPVRAVATAPPPRELADPLTEWLMRQLDEARTEAAREGNLREYRGQTLEWIDSLRDFLRY